jgi:hypothetical protein
MLCNSQTLYMGITGVYIPLLISFASAIYAVILLRKKLADRLFYVQRRSNRVRHFGRTIQSKSDYLRRIWSPEVVLATSHIILMHDLARKHLPVVLAIFALFVFTRILFFIYFGVRSSSQSIMQTISITSIGTGKGTYCEMKTLHSFYRSEPLCPKYSLPTFLTGYFGWCTPILPSVPFST